MYNEEKVPLKSGESVGESMRDNERLMVDCGMAIRDNSKREDE